MKEKCRISIIGGPGTGKSTLAENLGKTLDIPVYHLDAINHLKNWEKRDTKERDKIILEKVKENRWVIDGTYKSTIKERLKYTDIIIYLRYSTIAKLKGIITRYFQYKGKERPEIPGCKEKMDKEFIKFTLEWNKTEGKMMDEILKENEDKKILVFKNRKQLNKWYEKRFGEKIEVLK